MRRVCRMVAVKRILFVVFLYVCFLKAGKYLIPSTSYLARLLWIHDNLKDVNKELTNEDPPNHLSPDDTSERSSEFRSLLSTLDSMNTPRLVYINEFKAVANSQSMPREPQIGSFPTTLSDAQMKMNDAVIPTPTQSSPEKNATKSNQLQEPSSGQQKPLTQSTQTTHFTMLNEPSQAKIETQSTILKFQSLPTQTEVHAHRRPSEEVIQSTRLNGSILYINGSNRSDQNKVVRQSAQAPVVISSPQFQSTQPTAKPNRSVSVVSKLASQSIRLDDIDDLLNRVLAKCNTNICTQDQRQSLLQKQCLKLVETQYGVLSDQESVRGRLIVDDRHKLIYCAYPGAASMSMLYALYTADTAQKPEKPVTLNDLVDLGIQPLKVFSEEEQDEKLNSYYKILITRHPFDRLVSTWYHRIVSRKSGLYSKFARSILALAGRNTTAELAKGIKFKEFLDFVVYTQEKKNTLKKMTILWDTNMNLCHPCYISYDAILKTETFEFDSKDIQARLQLSEMPELNHHRKVKDAASLMTRLLPEFQEIDPNIINYFLTFYKADMDMFGYQWNADQNTAVCGTGTCESNSGYCC